MSRLTLVVIAGCAGLAHPRGEVKRTLTYAFVTVGRHAGDGEVKVDGNTRVGHYTFNDRGRGPDISTVAYLDDAGGFLTFHSVGHDYLKANVDEQLEHKDALLAWKSTSEKGSAAAGYYVPLQGELDGDALLAAAIARAPGGRLKLLPAGEAWIEGRASVDVSGGGTTYHLTRVAIAGVGFSPTLVWLDADGELFAEVSPWSSVIRAGAEAVIDDLVKRDEAWTSARAAKLASTLAHPPPAAGLAITHARLFDSETEQIVPDATVVIAGDKIAAVGDASTPIPPGARVVDAAGKTLLPGLWDMHVHLGDADGILDLASGVTTVRDLGNDPDSLIARTGRFDAGTEIGPRVLRAGLIDGPGELAAPTGMLAGTPDQALAAVGKYADRGYVQIKMYSSLDPKLVPIIAKAAHDRGLRVSGHVPNGMTAAQAVEAGYDEIQHVNFQFLQFLAAPTDDTRTPLRFTKVAEGAAKLDLDRPDVRAYLDLLVAHKTVLDPTLATFHGMFVADPGDLDPILAPYAGRLPAQVERGGHSGGLPTKDRKTFRASFAAMQKFVLTAWKRGIPIVAGTDEVAGLTLPHELELYVQAGIPAPDVLAIATIGAARVMGVDRDRGSIAAGKQADLILVDGDPTRDIGAVRATSLVVCRGIAYDPAELFAAVGMRGIMPPALH